MLITVDRVICLHVIFILYSGQLFKLISTRHNNLYGIFIIFFLWTGRQCGQAFLELKKIFLESFYSFAFIHGLYME